MLSVPQIRAKELRNREADVQSWDGQGKPSTLSPLTGLGVDLDRCELLIFLVLASLSGVSVSPPE